MSDFDKRKKLSIANSCRMFLYYGDFINSKQNDEIKNDIERYKRKENIEITNEQLSSVNFVYNDNAKEINDCQFIEHVANYWWGDDYHFMEIHGYAVGRVYTLKEEEGSAYIEGLHVSENERLKTIGSELLNKLIQKCIDLGAKECMLWCEIKSWVYDWYARLGFKYLEDKKDEEGYVWMVKSLKK